MEEAIYLAEKVQLAGRPAPHPQPCTITGLLSLALEVSRRPGEQSQRSVGL